MHGWDGMMSQTYEQNNWANPMQIKSEPMEMHGGAYSMDNKHQNDSSTNFGASDALDSMHPGTVNAPGSYYPSEQMPMMSTNIHQAHLQNRGHHQQVFNPLTPPGYPSALPSSNVVHHSNAQLQHAQHAQHQQSNKQPEMMSPSESPVYPTIAASDATSPVTSTLTPPMDDTPPKSPKFSDETPEKDLELLSASGDEFRSIDSDDDGDIRTPKMNSHGKVKIHRCKQCDFTAVTKLAFWEHTRVHIRPEKMLVCPKCPFVTEYKHHLDYHMLNHNGTKPFRCQQCKYTCVNKSMLNSHMKSHSNIYQYRCSDCNYATKYCHSLKLHLRKYSHQPAMVLHEDGSPNPLPVIDVYGTRRGPKSRSSKNAQLNGSVTPKRNDAKLRIKMQHQQQIQQQHQQQQIAQQSPQQIQHPTIPQSPIQQQSNQQQPIHQQLLPFHQQQALNHIHQQQQQQQQQQQHQMHMQNMSLSSMLNKNFLNMFPYLNFHPLFASPLGLDENTFKPESESHMDNDADQSDTSESPLSPEPDSETKCLDLSTDSIQSSPIRCAEKPTHSDDNIFPTPLSINPSTTKNRRKGRAYKLDILREQSTASALVVDNHQPQHMVQCTATPPSTPCTPKSSVFPTDPLDVDPSPSQSATQTPDDTDKNRSVSSSTSSDPTHKFECKPCGIAFKDAVLHTIHMGYHGFNDVFTCNMCGTKCEDRVSFFLHIARNSHM